MLFLNIVTGILLDTFAESREKRNSIENDKRNFCYICGMNKSDIEKNNENYKTHTEIRHCPWKYAFYIYIV